MCVSLLCSWARLRLGTGTTHHHLLRVAHATRHSSSHVDVKTQTSRIKELRERSGAPITDVKSSLVASAWDVQRAYEVLRTKGLAAAAKRSSRTATDGLIGVAQRSDAVAIVEVNSETDFVARSAVFQDLVRMVAGSALALPEAASRAGSSAQQELVVQELLASRQPDGRMLSDACADVAVKVRENITVRRAYLVASGTAGILGTYIHKGEGLDGLGRIAMVVTLEAADKLPLPASSGLIEFSEAARGLAMHAAGLKAKYCSRGDVPAEVLEKERQLLTQQAMKEGKPEGILAKVVEGRLAKFYEELCLLDQKYLLDDSMTVKQALARWSPAGRSLVVSGLLRVQVGEGLEAAAKQDFATEVSQLMGATARA